MADDITPKDRRGPRGRPPVVFAWAIVYHFKGRPVVALDTICYTQPAAQQRLAAWRALHTGDALATAHIARITLTVTLAADVVPDRAPASPTISPG